MNNRTEGHCGPVTFYYHVRTEMYSSCGIQNNSHRAIDFGMPEPRLGWPFLRRKRPWRRRAQRELD
jgi:hypothetical protein